MDMTSPRSSYGGGYYTAPHYPDTPIYDMLVAERGTPQIAPIRVPAEYQPTGSNLPALPALPSGNGQQNQGPPHGYAAPNSGPGGYMPAPQAPQPAPLQQAPQPYIPQQAAPQRYPDPRQHPQQQQPQQQPQMQPVAPRPAAPRPAPPRPGPGYEDPYGGHQYPGRGY